MTFYFAIFLGDIPPACLKVRPTTLQADLILISIILVFRAGGILNSIGQNFFDLRGLPCHFHYILLIKVKSHLLSVR